MSGLQTRAMVAGTVIMRWHRQPRTNRDFFVVRDRPYSRRTLPSSGQAALENCRALRRPEGVRSIASSVQPGIG